jgi:leader peptidase (prepilin peptidase)/N-methyltransferase
MFFALGACLGSFANVIIIRLPAGESVVQPASACRKCKTKIPWYHNIPIVSWLVLRGKCYKCKAPFSIRYPAVEFLMAVLFCWAYLKTGLNLTLVEQMIFIFAAVTASVIDLDYMILPDKLTLSGIVIGLIGAAINPQRDILSAFLGVLVGGGSLWLVAYLYFVFRNKEGMGGGDVKLLAWIGAVLGISAIPVVILLSSVLGAMVGLVLATRSKQGLKLAIPFGPYLVTAAIAYMLLDGPAWTRWYLNLHGLEQ